jgi:CheY-like chemotaxis protein
MNTKEPILLDERKEECKPLVLVVDDDRTHHKLMELLSKRLAFTAHITSSCTEAVEALNLFSFDVILMDYRMPEVDGFVCAKRIRAMTGQRGRTPIIAVTGHVTPGMREMCLAAGMDDFLGKPFTLEELHEKLCYWLQERTDDSVDESSGAGDSERNIRTDS